MFSDIFAPYAMAKLRPPYDTELTTMRKILIRLALAGAATTVLTGAALAQVPPPPAPPAPPPPPEAPLPPLPAMDMTMTMGPDMMFMHQGRHADPEKRAQRLRDILQLRGDQDGALKAYVDATTPKMVIETREVSKGGKDGDRMDRAERAPLTTLERLDRITQAADTMKKRAEATRAFYTALTPAQKKTFDILGMGEGEGLGDQHVFVRRFDTRGPMVKSGEQRIVVQRKVG